MRLKILHRYIVGSFFGPFILTFCIVVFVLLMQFLWLYIDELAGKGLSVVVIAELLVYTSASLVPLALPLAVLFSSIMTMGNLGENYELIAMKSAGISLQRILRPLITVSVLIALSAFFFANNILPYANLKMRSLLYDIRQKKPDMQINEGIFYGGLDNYSILISKKDYSTNTLFDLQIYDHTAQNGNTHVTIADSGYMYMTEDKKFLVIDLYQGYNYEELEEEKKSALPSERTYPFRRNAFQQQTLRIDMSVFELNRTDENLFKQSYQMMNLKQLTFTADSILNDAYMKQNLLGKSAVESTRKSYLFNRRVERDSLLTEHVLSQVPEPFSDYFTTLSTGEKVSVLQDAQVHARSLLENISIAESEYKAIMERQRRYLIEWQKKFSLSFACIMFFFIGAPLGALIRKGGLGVPLVISVLFFVIYYVISITGEKFAREGLYAPWAGIWLSSFIILPIGIMLFYQATHDSAALNSESYLMFIRRFSEKLRIPGKQN